MEGNIFLQLWEKCSKSELKRLVDFVRSPYFNKNEALRQLFEALSDTWPQVPADKESLFALAFPGQSYQYAKYRYLVSDAAALLAKFWSVDDFMQDEKNNQLYYLQHYSTRGLNKQYVQLFKKATVPGGYMQQVGDFFYAMRLYALDEEHFQRQRQRVFDTRIEAAALALDKYYYLSRLIYACGMLDRAAIFQGKYAAALPDSWFEYLQTQDCFGEPLLALYLSVWRMMQEPDEAAHFRQLAALLQNEHLAPAELRTPYLSAINFSLRKIRQGEEAYIKEALALYENGIDRGILTDDGSLSPWTFTNVVKLALRLRRFEWIQQFMAEKAALIPAAFRDNALTYNRAELYYYTGQHDEARQMLHQVEFNDLNYYLGARVILAKIYFEAGDMEPLLALLAAFTIFLKRNKALSPALKTTYLRFCEFLFQLTKAKPRHRERLKKDITEAPLLTDREWLLRWVG